MAWPAAEHSGPQQHSPRQNLLLAALSPHDYERLVPDLEAFALQTGCILHDAGNPQTHVYFLASGIVAKSHVMENGDSAAFALTGREGLIGTTRLHGSEGAPNRSTVISPGYSYRLPADLVKREFERDTALREVLLRYTQALMAQISLTAVCNRHHSIEQRLCRWILWCIERLPDNDLAMTQQTVADMLGARRESVTEAAGRLEKAGLIHCGRGHIAVLQRARMEARACECYAVVNHEYARLLGRAPHGGRPGWDAPASAYDASPARPAPDFHAGLSQATRVGAERKGA